MSRDRLLLLSPGFLDTQQPGVAFVCRHCIPVEGLLASAPELASRLDIERLPYPRPRPVVIAALDEAHQSLPCSSWETSTLFQRTPRSWVTSGLWTITTASWRCWPNVTAIRTFTDALPDHPTDLSDGSGRPSVIFRIWNCVFLRLKIDRIGRDCVPGRHVRESPCSPSIWP